MKTLIPEELEEKSNKKVQHIDLDRANEEWIKSNTETDSKILSTKEEIPARAETGKTTDSHTDILTDATKTAVSADDLHHGVLSKVDTHGLEVQQIDNHTASAIIEKKDEITLPTSEKKEESLAKLGDGLILPAVVNDSVVTSDEPTSNKDDEIVMIGTGGLIDEKKTEDKHLHEDSLVVGATMASKTDIGSFRDELLKDSKEVEKIQADNTETLLNGFEHRSGAMPEIVESTEMSNSSKEEIPLANPKMEKNTAVGVLSSNESGGGKIDSLAMNLSPTANIASANQSNEVKSGNIAIADTEQPGQKSKPRKIISSILIVLIILAAGVLGYLFAWPSIEKFMSGL